MHEPSNKRAIVYVDGQNLFNSAKEAFGYTFPNYDIKKLSTTICQMNSWDLTNIRFYTGLPDNSVDYNRYHFWVAKLAAMGTRGIETFSRPLKYSNQKIVLPDGSTTTTLVGREKGIDIRIALDIVSGALNDEYDVAIIFSQDQDLTEAVDEVKLIADKYSKWLKVACAFPISPTLRNKRGINRTDWIKIDKTTYDNCIDSHDYRKKKKIRR